MLITFFAVFHRSFPSRFHRAASSLLPATQLDACCSLRLLVSSAAPAIALNPAPAFFSCSRCSGHLGCRTSFLLPLLGACFKNVLGSCFSLRETNSAWPGSNLWGPSESLAPPRRCAQRWTRHGRHSFRQGHSLASRYRRTRQNPHSRALCFLAKKTPRKR